MTCATACEPVFAEAIATGLFPGAELLAATGGTVRCHQVWGTTGGPGNVPMKKGMVFDLASLTKPLATALLLSCLLDDGRLRLDDPVCNFLPDYAEGQKQRVTIGMLAGHTGGLAAHVPLYEIYKTPEQAHAGLTGMPLSHTPGTETTYSCLGYLVLGDIIQMVTGRSLSDLFDERIARPLHLDGTGYLPLQHGIEKNRIVPTNPDPLRIGVADDGNSRFLGGAVGNAGLFGTARDLLALAMMLMNGGEWNGVRILSRQSAHLHFTNINPPGLIPRTLGWEYRGRDNEGSGGPGVPEGAIGHTGFTGTSLWMDRQSQSVVIILTNRVLLSRRGNIAAMNRFRHQVNGLWLTRSEGKEKPQLPDRSEGKTRTGLLT